MTTKPLCVILDDEPCALESLRENIEEIDLLKIEKAYLNPDNLLNDLNNLESIIFLIDIEMRTSGIEVAKELKDKLIIFVSGHTGYISEVVYITPIAFIHKPIVKHKLKKAIEKAIENLKANKSNFIVLKTQNFKKEEIKHKDILYIHSKGRNKEVFLLNGDNITISDMSFKLLLNELPKDFIQINKDHIVNTSYATKLISSDLIGIDHSNSTIEITLGNTYKENFFKAKPHMKN